MASKCIKVSLIVYNVIFAFTGILIFAIGIATLTNVSDLNVFEDQWLITVPTIFIIVGILIFIIAALGCFGTLKEVKCLLLTFAIFITVILVAEILIGVVAAVFRNTFENAFSEQLRKTMPSYKTNTNNLAKVWDSIQTTFACCGVDKPEDWSQYGILTPKSCCKESKDAKECTKPYNEGCLGKLKVAIKRNLTIIMGIAIGFAFTQVAGIVLACFLAFQNG